MVSDDTEHSCMVAEAITHVGLEPDKFQRELARSFRWWLVLLPAGVGKATARAILKLWLGWKPSRSGVFSAGNGPAMRSAILGVAVEDAGQLSLLVRASARLTHTDPKAEYGAIVIATMARLASTIGLSEPQKVKATIFNVLANEDPACQELRGLVQQAVDSAASGETPREFADLLGLEKGVTGYTYHTVPVAVQACLRYPEDFREAIIQSVLCGGDTDTLAAIVGGVLGSAVGVKGLPEDWLSGLAEWPRNRRYIQQLAGKLVQRLESNAECSQRSPAALKFVVRNLFFLVIVLIHVARRVLPPY